MNRALWSFPIAGALIATALYTPLLYAKQFDLESLGYILLLFVLAVICLIVVIVHRLRSRHWIGLKWIFAAVAFLGISTLMFHFTEHLRPWARWLLAADRYTNLVLEQEPDRQTGLRYIQWDGWGWAGTDTSVELVYDPSDSLAHEIRYNPKGRFAEVADKTAFVQRLGHGWYSLTLYTGETL